MTTSLSIALNGSRRRDLQLYPGDLSFIDVVVYAKDGDTVPITVTGVNVNYGNWYGNPNLQSAEATFTSNFYWRTDYTMTGYVSGAQTTLCYGVITAPNFIDPVCGFYDYGCWRWGYQSPIVEGGSSYVLAGYLLDGYVQ